MSNALAIATVTAVLQDTLLNALIKAQGAESIEGAEVVTAYPGSEPTTSGAKPRVNIYLYQVTPNAALRSAELPARPGAVALDLHYLFSFYGREDTWEPQRLLGLTVRALSARAMLSRAGIDKAIGTISKSTGKAFIAGSNLSKAAELVKLTPQPLSLEEMSKLWSVFFQSKYTLSIAYQCSVVVIDPDAPATIARPVLERKVELVPLVRPVIDRVVAPAGEDSPIVPGSEVSVLGTDLTGQSTALRVGGVEVTAFVEASFMQIRFVLPAGLRAGVQGLQVIHRFLLGAPPTPHAGLESAPAAFVLRPVLTKVTRTVRTGPPRTTLVTADFTPAAHKSQRVTLILHRGDSSAPAQVFPAPTREDPAEASTIAFVVSDDVVPGKFVASLLVDGAESAPFAVELK